MASTLPFRPRVVAIGSFELPPACIEAVPACPLEMDATDHGPGSEPPLATTSFFVAGLYALDEADADAGQAETATPQTRSGALVLYSLTTAGTGPDSSASVRPIESLPLDSGVLDLHFSPFTPRSQAYASLGPTGSLLAVALSTGQLALYLVDSGAAAAEAAAARSREPTRLDSETDRALSLLAISQITPDPSILALALAWHPSDPFLLGVSCSDGSTRICRLFRFSASPQPSSPSTPSSWHIHTVATSPHTHSLEAWTLAFSERPAGILTGADDCALAFSDLQPHQHHPLSQPALDAMDTSSENIPPPVTHHTLVDSRSHSAGVTAILPLPLPCPDWLAGPTEPGLLLTGSYDEHIRLFRLHSTTASAGFGPLFRPADRLAESRIEGGGVWRLKSIFSSAHPECQRLEYVVLASCMHAGVRIVKISGPAQETQGGDSEWSIEILAELSHLHKSMNYASDAFLPTMSPTSNGCLDEQSSEVAIQSGIYISTSFYDKLLAIWKLEKS